MSDKKKLKLRLLKVTVSPEFVVEDDQGNLAPLASYLTNEDGSPIRLVAEVAAKDWPGYSSEGFTGSMAEVEKRLNSDPKPGPVTK